MLLAFGARLLGLLGLKADLARRFALVPLLMFAGLALWAGVAAFNSWQDRAIEQARDAGATDAIAAGHETTLDQVKDANNAETELETGGDRSSARHAECLRNSRRPEGCERFRPLDQQPVHD